MDVNPRLLAGKEEQPELAVADDGRCHGRDCTGELCLRCLILHDSEASPPRMNAAALRGLGFGKRGHWIIPPTADPHGGWCGGRELEAAGYPIMRIPQLD